jgi:DNA modification methylase
MENQILLGDCLDLMKDIPDGKIDMILCDLPYGVTQNKWDSVIPLDGLWVEYERVIKENGVIVLFGQDKFSAKVMLSSKNHRYNLIWDKSLTSGFLNANKMPLRSHEDIMVFYKKQPTYNPQKVKGSKNHGKGVNKKNKNNNYGDYGFVDNCDCLGEMKHPKSILTFKKPHPSVSLHPTEKPIDLLRWLVRAYTNEGDAVLDNAAGSGTTAIACLEENRKYILMEKEEKYYNIIKERVMAREKEKAESLF